MSERIRYCWNQTARTLGQPTLQTVWSSTVRLALCTTPARNTGAQSRENGAHAILICHIKPHRGTYRHPADSSPPIGLPLHRQEEKTSRWQPYDFIRGRAGQDWLGDIETTARKRRIRFAGLVARVHHEGLPKRVMFEELRGGMVRLGSQEKNRVDHLERHSSFVNSVVEETHWKLAVSKSGTWSRRAEDEPEQDMKRWLDEKGENVAK